MMIFKINNGKAIPTEYILGISPFSDIWERDKSKDKINAIKDFTFIEYYTSPRKSNPYSTRPEEERFELITKDINFLKGYKPDKLVYSAIEKYKEIISKYSTSYWLLEAAMKGADKLRNFLLTVDLDERDKSGKPVYRPSEVAITLEKVEKIIKSLNELRNSVEEELSEASKTYGDYKVNYFEL